MWIKKVAKENNKYINYDESFRDPINTFFEKIVPNVKQATHEVIEESLFQGYEDYKNEIDDLVKNINDVDTSIKKRKKTEKINARKAANGFIIFFSILIIGLCFLSFLLKNKKIIKEFNTYRRNQENIIKDLSYKKLILLASVFGRYSPSEIKDMVLEKFNIQKVKNVKEEELDIFLTNQKFGAFFAVNKYDIKNSYFYDILYSTLEWRIVTTQASRTITYRSGDSEVTETITAYHDELTPFTDVKHATVIPTNYLPELMFYEDDSKRKTYKEYNKAMKKGETLLENKDFHKNYGFGWNDNVKFLTYFQTLVQENYVKYNEYVNSKAYHDYKLNKHNHCLYNTTVWENGIESYHDRLDWIHGVHYRLNNSKLVDLVSYEDIENYLFGIIYPTILKNSLVLLKAYLNKNIASEVYKNQGEMFLSQYVGLDEQDNGNVAEEYNSITDMVKNQVFKMHTNEPARQVYHKIINREIDGNFVHEEVELSSFWAREEIDSQVVSGVRIDVPYVRFYPFEETKFCITNNLYHFNTPNAKMQYGYFNLAKSKLPSEDLKSRVERLGFEKSGVIFNDEATLNQDEFNDALDFIERFKDKFKNLNGIKIIINDQCLKVYIDSELKKTNPDWYEKIYNFVKRQVGY